ncbi:hypothetical protein CsSME_00051030 [Camellia sinensis var. sinensis]
MEEISKESNNDGNYPEELKEKGRAGLLLASMKYFKFDPKISNDLSIMKSEILDQFGPNPDEENTPQSQESCDNGDIVDGVLPINENFVEYIEKFDLKQPQCGQTIDGLEPPDFPPIKILHGLIKTCGRPFEKQLTKSDVKDDQSRLTVPKQMFDTFIKPVMNKSENIINGVPVTTFDSKGNAYPMTLKIWSSKTHVLTAGWKNFYLENKFIAHKDWITIWVCRLKETTETNNSLCFVIMARRFPIEKLLPKKLKTTRKRKHENHQKKESKKRGLMG